MVIYLKDEPIPWTLKDSNKIGKDTISQGCHTSWWRHQMETSSALLALCAGNSPVTGEFPSQRPVTRSFDVLYHLRLNKQLSKHSWGWWFETPSRSLWRYCKVYLNPDIVKKIILEVVRYIARFHVILSTTRQMTIFQANCIQSKTESQCMP